MYDVIIFIRFSVFQVLLEVNLQVAVFRDLLVHVGGARDSPEMREKIRKVRRNCVEAVIQTNHNLLPNIKM